MKFLHSLKKHSDTLPRPYYVWEFRDRDLQINNSAGFALLESFSHLEMGFFMINYFVYWIGLILYGLRAWKMHVSPWLGTRPPPLNPRRFNIRHGQFLPTAFGESRRKSQSPGESLFYHATSALILTANILGFIKDTGACRKSNVVLHQGLRPKSRASPQRSNFRRGSWREWVN